MVESCHLDDLDETYKEKVVFIGAERGKERETERKRERKRQGREKEGGGRRERDP